MLACAMGLLSTQHLNTYLRLFLFTHFMSNFLNLNENLKGEWVVVNNECKYFNYKLQITLHFALPAFYEKWQQSQ